MGSGRRIVALLVLVAAAFAAVMLSYAVRAEKSFDPAVPRTAAREVLEAHNVVIGTLGGIRRVEWGAEHEIGRDEVALEAAVEGARDRGVFYADLARRDGAWRVERASFVFPDGRRLPIRGDRAPALEPAGATPAP